MVVNHYTPTNGTLTLGTGPLQVAGQVRSCAVEPTENVTEGSDIAVLSGEQIDGVDKQTYSYTLTGTMLQDLLATGVVAWAWENAGTEQPFTFTPNGDVGPATPASITGTVIPVPLRVGGDVLNPEDAYEPADAEFTWRIKGTPVPTWGA